VIEFNPYAYEVHEDPYPFYTQLRAEAPVDRDESVFERSDEYDLTRAGYAFLPGRITRSTRGGSLARGMVEAFPRLSRGNGWCQPCPFGERKGI